MPKNSKKKNQRTYTPHTDRHLKGREERETQLSLQDTDRWQCTLYNSRGPKDTPEITSNLKYTLSSKHTLEYMVVFKIDPRIFYIF